MLRSMKCPSSVGSREQALEIKHTFPKGLYSKLTSSSLMITFSPFSTSIPYVVLNQRSQKSPSTKANPTCFLSSSRMVMRMFLAARKARWSSRSSASSIRSCFVSRSSFRSNWNNWVCLSIHSRAAFFSSLLARTKSSACLRLRIPSTTYLPVMISRAFAAFISGTMGSHTVRIQLRTCRKSLISLGESTL